ncbi:MAG TPA: tRNA-uridine aminocarboxypropyltransferase, partial [Polyangiaceae bacterium]|nr:tRNA-uridine aminocarboxypropyltransferase [Polyangiaceae bacterium]
MTAPGAPGRCPRCLLLADYCLCELIGAGNDSRPRVVIVRHHWEAFKSTGTARLAGLALSNLSIVDMAAENPAPVREALSALGDAWLLYPSGSPTVAAPGEAPETLVVLDGTWRQTRRMLRRLPELSRFPRYSLSAETQDAGRDRLREPPRAGARSTLESIADALGQLDSPACGRRLLDLHEAFVA